MKPCEIGAGAGHGNKLDVTYSPSVPGRPTGHTNGREYSPIIDVSESDGFFHVRADFSMTNDFVGRTEAMVEFARQGVVITQGTLQRYIPIPTDGEIDRAKVTNNGGIVHISVPTAGLGQRWRSIIMW
jgi:hypothetical protein